MTESVKLQEAVDFQEAVIGEMSLRGNDRLVVACIYRSDSSSAHSNTRMCEMIRNTLPSCGASHILCVGDFNCPDIDWIDLTSTLPQDTVNVQAAVLEAFQDSFLTQHVTECTHFKPHCKPSLIDLVWTNEEGMVKNLEHVGTLGFSHHSLIKFELTVSEPPRVSEPRPGPTEQG